MSYYCEHCDKPVPGRICPTCLQPAAERENPASPEASQRSSSVGPGATQSLTRPVSRLLQEATAPTDEVHEEGAESRRQPGGEEEGERQAKEAPGDGGEASSREAGTRPQAVPPPPQGSSVRPEPTGRTNPDLEGTQAIPRSRITSFPSRGSAESAASESKAAIKTSAQQELLAFLEDGYQVVLVGGIGGVGKTQLLDAYRKPGTLSMLHSKKDDRGGVLPTATGHLDCYPVKVGDEKVIFVDAAGESFVSLYPHLRQGGRIDPGDVDFLRTMAQKLRGVVLLLDLRRLWSPQEQDKGDHRQDEILAWLLQLLRWLRFSDGQVKDGMALEKQVVAETGRMRQRLPEPVLVLFSKADELISNPVPLPARDWRDKQEGRGSRRSVFPLGDDPFFLAYHHLEHLYGAVREHAEHFRFDFVQSVVVQGDTGMLDESGRCGVRSSVEWLLDEDWDKHNLPTRYWIALQKLVDTVTGRGRRWRHMPEPREMP